MPFHHHNHLCFSFPSPSVVIGPRCLKGASGFYICFSELGHGYQLSNKFLGISHAFMKSNGLSDTRSYLLHDWMSSCGMRCGQILECDSCVVLLYLSEKKVFHYEKAEWWSNFEYQPCKCSHMHLLNSLPRQ